MQITAEHSIVIRNINSHNKKNRIIFLFSALDLMVFGAPSPQRWQSKEKCKLGRKCLHRSEHVPLWAKPQADMSGKRPVRVGTLPLRAEMSHVAAQTFSSV